jgi:hypothetical protein
MKSARLAAHVFSLAQSLRGLRRSTERANPARLETARLQ